MESGAPIPFGRPMIGEAERAAVAEVLAGTTLTHGPRVREFERRFAAFTGAPHAIATASCMAALHLTYLAIELGPGDEVVVPAQTHVATAHAVELCGARPVFYDADPETGNLDPDTLEPLITERTRAISVVHYLGLPVDMRPVVALARRHGLVVVEDCAVALGARIEDVHVGLWGDVGCFSFYPVKHISTGEGGMVVTTRADLAERIASQRGFGIDRNVITDRRHTGAYDVVDVGLNYRLAEVNAALGAVQLDRLPDFLARREANYERLAAGLAELDALELLRSGHDGALRASHYCLSALLRPPLAAERDAVIDALAAQGIGTSVYYPRALPDTAYYARRYGHPEGSCPVATRISTTSIAFPVGPHVSAADVDRISETVKETIVRTPTHA